MKRICWALALVFAVTTSLLAYKFLWKGEVVPASDGRTAILLTPGERDLVLGEMRAFLQAVQVVLVSAGSDDLEAAVAAARGVGATAQEEVPASLVGKLPGEFKALGFDTHRKFDALALDAEQLGDPEHALGQLAELMSNCVACHAAYRIDAVVP